MARLKISNMFDGIFEGKESLVSEGLEWVLKHYELTNPSPQEVELLIDETMSAFAGAINKKKLAKINLLWKQSGGDTYIGIAPAETFYSNYPKTKGMVMIIMIERYEGKINLIDPITGEIRQNIPKK
jgi:hypothetical protein